MAARQSSAVLDKPDRSNRAVGKLAVPKITLPRPLPTSKPIIRDGWAILTPELYYEIDALAKQMAGMPIQVCAHEELGEHAYCCYSWWAVGVHIENRPDSPLIERGVLELANRINIEQFHGASVSRLDRAHIPAKDIYTFLVLCMIGQRLWGVSLPELFNTHPRTHWIAKRASLTRGDRFAWRCLYGRQSMPRSAEAEASGWASRAEGFIRWHPELFPDGYREVRPLPTEPNTYVPREQVLNGIPWAT
jgi:hypothetical protein